MKCQSASAKRKKQITRSVFETAKILDTAEQIRSTLKPLEDERFKSFYAHYQKNQLNGISEQLQSAENHTNTQTVH